MVLLLPLHHVVNVIIESDDCHLGIEVEVLLEYPCDQSPSILQLLEHQELIYSVGSCGSQFSGFELIWHRTQVDIVLIIMSEEQILLIEVPDLCMLSGGLYLGIEKQHVRLLVVDTLHIVQLLVILGLLNWVHYGFKKLTVFKLLVEV